MKWNPSISRWSSLLVRVGERGADGTGILCASIDDLKVPTAYLEAAFVADCEGTAVGSTLFPRIKNKEFRTTNWATSAIIFSK